MRAGVYPSAGVWQAMAAETVFVPDGIEVLLRAVCAVQRAACTAAPLQRAVYWPPCVPGSEWQAALCVRQGVQQSVQGWRDALVPAAGLTRRRPVCGRTQRPLLEGRRHRGTDPPASLGEAGIQRGAAAVHIAASSKRCPGKMLCPYEELQPGRAACDALTALRSAVSEDRGGTRARRGRSAGMHAPVAAPGAGLHAPPGALYQPHLIDVYYLSVTPCLYRRTTSRGSQPVPRQRLLLRRRCSRWPRC